MRQNIPEDREPRLREPFCTSLSSKKQKSIKKTAAKTSALLRDGRSHGKPTPKLSASEKSSWAMPAHFFEIAPSSFPSRSRSVKFHPKEKKGASDLQSRISKLIADGKIPL